MLINYCGWNSLSQFQNITDADINQMEKFAQEELWQLLSKEETETFYGIFFKKLMLFKILNGHRNLLISIKNACVELYGGERLKLSGQTCRGKCRSKDRNETNKPYKLKQTSSRLPNLSNPVSRSQAKNNNAAITEDETHILNISRNYIKAFCNKKLKEQEAAQILNKINKLKVDVIFENPEEDPLFAHITCIICEQKIKVSVAIGKYGRKWICSNFNSHFKTHFEGELNGSDKLKQKPTQKSLKTVSILEFVNVKNPKKNVTSADTIDLDDVSTISGLLTSQSTLETNADLESSLQDHVTERENAVVYRSVGGSPSIAEFNSDSDPNLNSTRASDSNDLITQDFFENGRTFHEAENSAVSLKPRNVIFTDTPKKSKWQDEKYSRRQRNCRRLEWLSKDQAKITSFFEIKEHMQQILAENTEIGSTIIKSCKDNSNMENINMSNFLTVLMTSAQNNSSCSSNHNRFTDELIKFSLYLFIIGGKLTYETLESNLKNVLPSLSTLKRTLNENVTVQEGVLYMANLKMYLNARKLPLKVFISEDQTAVLKRIQYDPKSNKLVGFVLDKNDETGFPLTEKFIVNSAWDIQEAFQTGILSNNAYVFMAQPLEEKVPAFCLCIFGSDNKFTYKEVVHSRVTKN
ncbi:uncharacterized protein [Temnothorax longispinosus]|uniref:uncharacterized protein n=1 Tax=Temnothorax longispinosus TaxID=300112 RepID=UPI003A99E785